MEYRYPATLEPDEEGRVLVRFADLPEALTDGADLAEALLEAADCLSEALASRIVDGEAIPRATPPEPGQRVVSPSPTIALKAALYEALRRRDMTVADLAAQLDMDWHQAARLIDPRRASKLTSLSAALGALDCQILLSVHDPKENGGAQDELLAERFRVPAKAKNLVHAGADEPGQQVPSLSDATLRVVRAHPEGATGADVIAYLSREFGLKVRPNQLGIVLRRHRQAGQLENRDQRWYPARSRESD